MASARGKILKTALGTLVLLFALCAGASVYVEHRYLDRIVRLAQAPQAPVALVFGAGLGSSTVPSPVLAARLDAAVGLYRDGKVARLLLSGDGSDRHHDETGVMRRYVLEAGVPKDAIEVDPEGLSTYDSCYRAREDLGVTRAVLVTQELHLTRALFIANSLGIDAVGVAADESRAGHSSYEVREFFSRALALGMVVVRPEPRPADAP